MSKAVVIAIVGGIGLCFVIGTWGGKITADTQQSSAMREMATQDELTIEMIRANVDGTNEQLPIPIGDDVRMDRLVAGPGKRIDHLYTLVKDRNYYLPAAEMKAKIGETHRISYCSNTQSKELLLRGVAFTFSYFDNQKNPVFSYTLNSIDSCAGIEGPEIDLVELTEGARELDAAAKAVLREKLARINQDMPYEIGDGITARSTMDAGSRVVLILGLADAGIERASKQIEAYQTRINHFICTDLRLKFDNPKDMDFRSILGDKAGKLVIIVATDPDKDCAA
ncbi:hypothetical protein [Chitiniphilus eburneus]|uniref:Uncharacterized protein n=1 Tax=Chitiniphilus eburneus TaxID=2571148 RepID=A0A4U0QN79_9NEIS|nr:hypothetical protein [Chitiniphilus eburneus]TJZ77574.1 hypothetical protein FAZ21_04425 [Chitiniphilus eburneus]